MALKTPEQELGARAEASTSRAVQGEAPDAGLIEVLSKDFQRLADRSQDAIYRLAMRNLGDPDSAREATQEVFMRAWQKLGRWRLGRGKPFTWLYRTLMNVCREFSKKAFRQQVAL